MGWKSQNRTAVEVEVETEQTVSAEDLDDVIEIAARMMMEEEGALTADEVKDVAAELDIPAEYIDRARAKLEKDRVRERLDLKRKKSRTQVVVFVGLAVSVGFGLVAILTNSGVAAVHQDALAQRAKVITVLERQKMIAAQYEGRPDSPDRDAEIIGAQNRVNVETMRYIDLVSDYNTKVTGFPANFTTVFSSLPSELDSGVKIGSN